MRDAPAVLTNGTLEALDLGKAVIPAVVDTRRLTGLDDVEFGRHFLACHASNGCDAV